MPKPSKEQRIQVYIRDVLQAIRKIEIYVNKMVFEAFEKDEKTQDAVIRNLEIIGEAIKLIPTDVREKVPTIPWKSYTGIRDIMIHQYFRVDLRAIWDTIQKDLPQLKKAVQKILHDIPFFHVDK